MKHQQHSTNNAQIDPDNIKLSFKDKEVEQEQQSQKDENQDEIYIEDQEHGQMNCQIGAKKQKGETQQQKYIVGSLDRKASNNSVNSSEINKLLTKHKQNEADGIDVSKDNDQELSQTSEHTSEDYDSDMDETQQDYHVKDGGSTILNKNERLKKTKNFDMIAFRNKKSKQLQLQNEQTKKKRQNYKTQQSLPTPSQRKSLRESSRNSFESQPINKRKISILDKAKSFKFDEHNLNLETIKEEQNHDAFSKRLSIRKPFVQKTESQRRWSLIKNILQAIAMMRRHHVQQLEASDIVSEIRRYPKKTGQTTLERYQTKPRLDDPLDEIRRQNKFFQAIAFGGEAGLNRVQEMLAKNPKRFMLEPSNPNHMVNLPNTLGLRPIYIAAINGHLNVLKHLIQYGADPFKKSQVNDKEKETILQVSARWNHVEVVKYLLNDLKWSTKDIQEAIKSCEKDSKVRNVIINHGKKKIGACKTCCAGSL